MKHFKAFHYLLIIISLGFLACNKKGDQKLPNIILIMADDMGYESLSCYGNTVNKTPVLDSLASEGIRFTHCISQPLCTPSRVKIMTGKYNYRNYQYFGRLGSEQLSFGNLFEDKGYATCIAGKWQLNGLAYKKEIHDWNDPTRPHHFGFQEYCLWQLTQERKKGERYADPLIEKNGQILPRDKDLYGPDLFCDFILDFIERKKEGPFFIYYPMVLVHDPFVPTPDSEEWKEDSLRYRSDTRYFKDMVEYSDRIVGKISSKLKDLGLNDNTLLIFTGDNGNHPSITSQTIQGPIRGGKGNTTDAGTRVPLIIYGGNQIKNTGVYEGLVAFSDFYASFAELTGESLDHDGKSFLPVLQGHPEKYTRKTAFVHYDPKWGKNVNKHRDRFIRTINYKLYQDGKFYHLLKDPLEEYPIPDSLLTEKEAQIKMSLLKEIQKHPEWIEK